MTAFTDKLLVQCGAAVSDTRSWLSSGQPTPAQARDHELVRALLGGDEASFRTLVTQLQPLLLRIASRFVRSTAVAEEVVQDTWLAVLEGLSGFAGRSSLKTWIVHILVNRARTRGVREARSLPMSALSRDDSPEAAAEQFRPDGSWSASTRRMHDESSPERLLQDAQARALVEAAITELPEQQRLVIELHDVAELDAAEVCELLMLSEGNQRVLLHRARHKVREALAQHTVR